jgi:Hypoxia induced protein conserved region
MPDPLAFLSIVLIVVVLIILLAGVVLMAVGGEANRRYANRLMRWRVGVQALAIVTLLAWFFFGRG